MPQPAYRWLRFLGRTSKQFNAPAQIWSFFALGEPNKTVGIVRLRVSELPESAQHQTAGASLGGTAESMIAPHNIFRQRVLMSDYRSKEVARRIIRCATCDGMVFAEFAGFGRADANGVCTFCGMSKTDLPFEGGDYFDVLMRSRPTGRAKQLRGAQ